jgi:hypothetical protein
VAISATRLGGKNSVLEHSGTLTVTIESSIIFLMALRLPPGVAVLWEDEDMLSIHVDRCSRCIVVFNLLQRCMLQFIVDTASSGTRIQMTGYSKSYPLSRMTGSWARES